MDIVQSKYFKYLKNTYKGRDFIDVLEELYAMIVESSGLQLSFEVTLISQQNKRSKKSIRNPYKSKLESLKIFTTRIIRKMAVLERI